MDYQHYFKASPLISNRSKFQYTNISSCIRLLLGSNRLRSDYLHVTFRLLSGYLLFTFRLFAGYFQITCSLLSDYLQVTFRLFAGYFQVTFYIQHLLVPYLSFRSLLSEGDIRSLQLATTRLEDVNRMLVANTTLGYGEVAEALREQEREMERIFLTLLEALQIAARSVRDAARVRARIQIYVTNECQPYIRTIPVLTTECRSLPSHFRTARLRDRAVSQCRCFIVAVDSISRLTYASLRAYALRCRDAETERRDSP